MQKVTNDTTLIDWLKQYREYKKSISETANTTAVVSALIRHLQQFGESFVEDNSAHDIDTYNICTRARLSEIGRSFCEGFVRYLSHAKSLKDGESALSPQTQHHYFIVLRAALNMAVREGLIASNPIRLVRKELRVRLSETPRVFLSLNEVRMLLDTPFRVAETRRAFLFSCFSGLRISDIRRLTWGNLSSVVNSEGETTIRLSIVMKKTGRSLSFNLSQEALRQLLPRNGQAGSAPVFVLPSDVAVNKQVKQWAALAGITKQVCFHTARHTFATTAITLGADIYTVSKLLGHTNIATTQIYARIVDQKKDEALRRFDVFFGGREVHEQSASR